jgi:hypothetical protein
MWFRCSVRGENFPGELVGSPGDVGFYTTRFIEAPDAAQAEARVLANLKEDPAWPGRPATPRRAGRSSSSTRSPSAKPPTCRPGNPVWCGSR